MSSNPPSPQDLSVVALSAPHLERRVRGEFGNLSSETPFSLLNALRGAFAATRDRNSSWSSSNLSDEKMRENAIAMFDDLPGAKEWLQQRLIADRPNLVLIGAMTLSLPGAIECAKLVREVRGKECLIVLGGKHITECLWRDKESHIHTNNAFPKGEAEQGLFDVLVSGDAEDVVRAIGEALAVPGERPGLVEAVKGCRGDWVICVAEDDHPLEFVGSTRQPILHDQYPDVHEFYPVKARFPVFGGSLTAHAYSYSSRGCIMSCHFCSEGAHINGAVKTAVVQVAADRLADQLVRLQSGHDDLPVAAFVEDSILLQGHPASLDRFAETLIRKNYDAKFGAQLTIDMVLHKGRRPVLEKLKRSGLDYLFVGLETGDDEIASQMSKNSGKRKGPTWIERAEEMIETLNSIGIALGVSLLFGLGENQEARLALLSKLREWQTKYGQPEVVSMNWAVQHPLRSEGVPSFREWGISAKDDRFDLLASLFGEASTEYCLEGIVPPTLSELQELERDFLVLSRRQ